MRKRLHRLRRNLRLIDNKQAWKYYLQYFKWRWHILVCSFLLTIGQAVVFLPIAMLLRKILNVHIKNGETGEIMQAGFIVLGLLLVHAGIRLGNKRLILNHNKVVHNRLRDELFIKMYNIPKTFYTRLEGMKWHTIFTHDVIRLDAMSAALFTQFLPAIVICLALGAVMIVINVWLFVIVMAVTPLIFVTMLFTTTRLKKLVFARRRAIQKYNKRINFALQMMDLTRIQVAEDEEITKQEEHNALIRSLDIRTAWLGEIFRTVQETLIMVITIVLLVGGGMAAVNQSISLGDLFTFYVVFMFTRRYIFQLFNFFPMLINGNEALERVYEIASVDADRPYHGSRQPVGEGSIEVENISFSYGREMLLEDVSFHIHSGEFVALQGDNGSGKTTLLYMILGFYKPHTGLLRYGGIPYEEIDIKAMRREFGVVLQESPIFRGSIYENIMYGRQDVSEEEFRRACAVSGVDHFVDDLSGGYQTQVGDAGLLLSGGQRQRIAIARALVTRPKVLVLDEPTNHLDKTAVASLLKYLQDLEYNPTILMISHMDTFVAHTDRILRIDNGRVTEPRQVASS